MSHQRVTCFILFLLSLFSIGAQAEDASTIWYKTPAINWNSAFPIGNGRMGAMVFAVPQQDKILLYERNGSKQSIDLRRGELNLNVAAHKNYKNYKRVLNLHSAVATMDYTAPNGVAYHREYMASFSDSVLVIRLSTPKKEALTCNLTMKSTMKRYKVLDGQAMLILAGTTDQADETGTKYRYVTVVKPWVTGGRCGLEKGTYTITKADEAVIYVASLSVPSTDERSDVELAEYCAKTVSRAYGKDVAGMRKKHEARYQQLFNQVRLNLGRTAQADKPTDQRMKEQEKNPDPSLMTLYADYCRYLLISNTINATQVLPMQSLWTEQVLPVVEPAPSLDWYQTVETWGLSALREPLFRTASTKADAAAVHRLPIPLIPGGNLAYVNYLWEHYLFTGDKTFLSQHFPFMQATARIYLDSMKTGNEEKRRAVNTVFAAVMGATEILHTGIKGRLSPERAFADSLKKRYQVIPASTFAPFSSQVFDAWKAGFTVEPSNRFEEHLAFPSRLIECLLQSRDGYIFVLPALPTTWKDGSVSGLKARGGFVVSFTWKSGKLASLSITSNLGGMCRIRSKAVLQGMGVKVAKGEIKNPLLGLETSDEEKTGKTVPLFDLPTEMGKTYELTVINQ